MNKVCISIVFFLFLSSCYEEVELTEDRDKVVFELSVSSGTQEFIYTSKDTAYSIQDPDLELMFNDKKLALKEMHIRGRTTLDYRRKSYSVHLKEPIFVWEQEGGEVRKLTRFKLISLSMDYTYIKNRIAFGILEQAGLMPLFYKFVEFKINGNTQGVYFLVEDPEQFSHEQGAEFILRRDYHHVIRGVDYEPDLYHKPSEEYVSRYKEIYIQLPDLKGEALYESLNSRLDMNQYFRKMGIDYLLQNGDYTDEVYFFAMIELNEIRYKIIPWDYDDIFSRYPHEVGRSWSTGNLFGEREYTSHQDVLDEIGQKMIFSIEDDLDYAIAMDPFLYARFEQTLADLMKILDANALGAIFDQVEDELTPFYNDEAVISQSSYDYKPTSFEIWQNNMQEKQILLEERLESMRKQLQIQDKS